MTIIELTLTTGAVVTAFQIGRTINKVKIKELLAQNSELKDLVDAENYTAKKHEESAIFWRKMYVNNTKRRNGQEAENLVKNGQNN